MSTNNSCLVVKDVERYFGGLAALGGVSFSVCQGQVKSVVGPNGAGKTTLFNIITGFDHPTKGQIFCFNQDITSWPADRIVKQMHIARTFQITRIFSNLTVLQNAMIGRHTRSRAGALPSILKLPWVKREEDDIRDRALEVLDFVGLKEHWNVTARNLPYGQQKLLEIARALATEPQILLLDEPAAGLNESEVDELSGVVKLIRDAGITTVLIEHQMRMVMSISDDIVVLNFGKKLTEGTPVEVQKDPRVIEAYLGGVK